MSKAEDHSIKMGDDNCPYCGYEINRATGVQGHYVPVPKDLSICINCTGIMQYGEDMALQEFPKVLQEGLSEEQLDELDLAIELIHLAKLTLKKKKEP